jgi:hypothetical protein
MSDEDVVIPLLQIGPVAAEVVITVSTTSPRRTGRVDAAREADPTERET